MSLRARSRPCTTMAIALGESARVTASRSVKRRDQPLLSAGRIFGSSADKGAWAAGRNQPVKLRHDVICGISFHGMLGGGQWIFPFQDRHKRFARTRHAAFHRSNRAIADRSRIFIRKSTRTHQNESFALLI